MFSIDWRKSGVGIFSNKKIPAIFTDGRDVQFTMIKKKSIFFISNFLIRRNPRQNRSQRLQCRGR